MSGIDGGLGDQETQSSSEPGDVMRLTSAAMVWMAGMWADVTDDCGRLSGAVVLALLSS